MTFWRRRETQDKSLLATYEYTPYGQPSHFSGPTPTFGYTGHMWDTTMAMYWTFYRYYMPGNAPWHMRDPLGMTGGINLYTYPYNPVLFVDPLGLLSCKGWVGIGAVVVGATIGNLAASPWLALGGVAVVADTFSSADEVLNETQIEHKINRRNRAVGLSALK